MAYGLKYYFVDKKIVGSTETIYRFEILKDGYSGSSTEWTGISIKRQYEEFSFRQINNIQKSTCNGQIRVEDSAQRTILEGIASAELGDYQVKLKKNGSVVWTGLLVPDLTTITEENYGNQSVHIQAKDILFSDDYTLATGSQKAIVIIADLLDTLGYGLNIKTYTTWTESEISASDDVLNQVYHEKERLRIYAKTSGEVDRPISNEQALMYMLKTYGLILRQANNEWQLIQLSALDDTSSVPTTTYNSSGLQQGSPLTNVNLRESVDSDDLYLLGSSSNNYFAGIKRNKAKFDHQSVVQGIKIPRELWLTTTNESYSQFWQGDGTGNISLEFNLWVADTGSLADTYPSAQIRIQSGAYYWNGTTWGTSSTEITIQVSGPTTTDSDGNHVYKSGLVSIVTDPIPDDADGTLTITFIPSLTIVTSVVYSYFRDIIFNLSFQDDIENSLSIDFELEQTGTFNAEYDYGSFYFGDGPATASLSALKDSNDDLTDAWKQIGEATSVSHQEILLREILDFQRGQRRNIRATLYGEFEPDKVVQYDSKSFFFLGGSWDSKSYQWTSNLIEADPTTGTDTLTTYYNTTGEGVTTSASTGSTGGGSGSSSLYLEKTNNLSDLQSVSTARDNLGLGTGDDVVFNTVTADFIGDLTGAIHVQGKNETGGTLTKGTPVYISGQVAEGQQFSIGVADSDDSSKMPSIGVLSADVNNNAMGDIVTHGKFIGIDTSSFTVGDELFIGPSGTLVNTPPTGESNLLQKIAKVIRVNETDGQIYIMGAGRTNAVPNLDEGDIFIGDSNNQAITKALSDTAVINELESDVIENHLEIESLQDNKVEKGQLFPDGDEQALGTGDAVNFSTVNTGQGDNELYAMDQDVQQADSPTFSRVVLSNQADDGTKALRADREVNAGNGLGGGGALTSNLTISLDTPSTTTVSSTNAVTADSHTHALDLSGRSITLSDDLDGIITFNVNTQDLGADRTFQPTIADHANGQRGVLRAVAQTIFGEKSFNNNIFPLADVETTDFSSWFSASPTGYQISQAGVGDFRTLYIDELVAKAFTADVAQALAGSDILTKSVAILAEDYTIASVGSTTSTIVVEDLPGLGGFAVFENGDYIRMRVVDRTAGLTIGDVYASVTLDTSYGTNGYDSSTSTQRYILDIESAGSGDVLVGQKLYKGAVILDYGTSGSYYIERTVLDRSSGSDFSKVPYNRIVQWTNTVSGSPNPSDSDTVITVITQSGNLANLTSTYSYSADPDGAFPAFAVDGFGFFSDNAYLTGEFRVGDLQSYGEFIQYNTTDGLTIKIGDEDDLSASVAELRQDVIDIYLADQSTFAGIQFLSGQITLKVGADGKVASARLDATGDESAITLRADFFDFQSDDIVILGDPDQDAGTEAKIALGSNADTITVANTTAGFIASGAGEFKGYIDANNFIRLDSTGLDIKAESFDLETSTIVLNSASSGRLIVGADADNQLVDDGVGFFVTGNGNFRVGTIQQGDDSYIKFDGTTVSILTNTFDLESGNLHIDSEGTTFPNADTGNTSSDAGGRLDNGGSTGGTFTKLDLTINNSKYIKFQFDYSFSRSGGSFTPDLEVEILEKVSGSFRSISLFNYDNSYFLNSDYVKVVASTGLALNVTNISDNNKLALRFTNTNTSNFVGVITFYVQVTTKGTATALALKFTDNTTDTSGQVNITDIDGVEYNAVTELNPNGIFTRLSDSLILSNGTTVFNPNLVTSV